MVDELPLGREMKKKKGRKEKIETTKSKKFSDI